jgi:thermitase
MTSTELPMSATILLSIIAFLLIAWDASRRDRNPLVVLVGFILLFSALIYHLFSGAGIVHTAMGIFFDAGVGLVLAAVLLAVRRVTALPFFMLGLMALGLAGLLYGGAHLLDLGQATEEAPDAPAPEALLVELGPDDRIEEIAPLLAQYGARYEQAFPTFTLALDQDLAQVYLVYGSPAALGDLKDALGADVENVDHVAWNATVSLSPPDLSAATPAASKTNFLTNDPLAASQWALEAARFHEAHTLLREAQPVRKAVVAIVDTGVDGAHEDLRGITRQSPGLKDENGHGTHCAGIAAAVTNNSLGIASLNWDGRFVDVAGYQALSAAGMGTLESIAQAILDAARDGVDVISLSLGDYSPAPPKVIVDAIRYARQQGALVVASAGNAGQDGRTHMPSNIEGVFAVAAIDANLKKARFSNTVGGLSRPLAAPGVDVLSLLPGNEYAPRSGTSMATPMVSGLLGVLRALDPGLTEEEAYALLYETGTPLEETAHTGRLINAAGAIRALLQAS